jgi:hypothetical protein
VIIEIGQHGHLKELDEAVRRDLQRTRMFSEKDADKGSGD